MHATRYMIALNKVKQNGKGPCYQCKAWVKDYKIYLRLLFIIFCEHYHFLVESGSEFSYFIPEPINFSEVTRLLEDINTSWLNATLREIQNLINNQTFLVQDTEKGEPVTPCMDFYKSTN